MVVVALGSGGTGITRQRRRLPRLPTHSRGSCVGMDSWGGYSATPRGHAGQRAQHPEYLGRGGDRRVADDRGRPPTATAWR